MPKKKGQKKNIPKDFTINDSANAPKPVGRVKKSTTIESPPDLPWDQIQDEDFDIVEETGPDGTKNLVYRKKKNSKSEPDNIEDRPGIVYPEIVWYQISKYIRPEDIGSIGVVIAPLPEGNLWPPWPQWCLRLYAGINKTTYSITQQKSFWRLIYKKYCEGNPKLPERLKIENSFKSYGLRQRVIRALYHTYDLFLKKIAQQAVHDSKPHDLVKRRCVNVWFCKGPSHWSVFFKFRKLRPLQVNKKYDFIKELGRIDANPEEDSQVLQITCQNFYEVPPLMGMILSSVSVVLSQGFRHHRLHLGFNTGLYNVAKNILPECTVVLDTVVNITVLDWWHPKYPHFENKLPGGGDEEMLPVLKKDFFDSNI